MAEATAAEINRKIERAERVVPFVLDADQHVNPPPTMWREYLSPAYRDRAPEVESDGEFDYVVFEGNRAKVNLMGSQAGRRFDQYKNTGRLSDQRVGGWMAPSRIEDMDADGIDMAVIYGGGPLATRDIDLYVESFAAYGRWVADFCSHDPERLHHIAYIPMLDVDLAVKMMREANRLGAVAVNIPAFPQSASVFNKMEAQAQALTGDQGGSRQYRDAEFDPLWATACELDMPLTFHLGGRVSRFADKVNFLPDMPMARLAMCEVAGILVYGGVFDRFPALRVGIIESGVGWMPWAVAFMDRSWEMQRHWTGCEIQHPPSYYFDQNIYASFISDPAGIALRHHAGCKNMMWSSDYPHSETTFPSSQRTLAQELHGVPDAERDWIAGGCAKQFYGI